MTIPSPPGPQSPGKFWQDTRTKIDITHSVTMWTMVFTIVNFLMLLYDTDTVYKIASLFHG